MTGPAVLAVRRVARERLVQFLQEGTDPLEMLIKTAFNSKVPLPLRIQAAAVATPYLHPRLSQQTIDARTTVTSIDGTAMLQALQDRLARLGSPTAPTIDAPALADADAEAGR